MVVFIQCGSNALCLIDIYMNFTVIGPFTLKYYNWYYILSMFNIFNCRVKIILCWNLNINNGKKSNHLPIVEPT